MTDTTYSFESLEWDRIISFLRDKTVSSLGSGLVDSLVPSVDPDLINQQLDYNFECRQIIQLGVRFPISGCSDISELLHNLRVANYSLTPDEINEIAGNLETAGSMQRELEKHRESYPGITSLTKSLVPHEKITKDIRKKIDEDGNVLDSASPLLKKLRRQIGQKLDQVRTRADEIMKSHAGDGILQENHVSMRGGRYVLPVRDSYSSRISGITHDISSTGSTVFIEPAEIVERNNEISRLRREESEEVRRILSEISAKLSEITVDLESNQGLLGRLDFHYACGLLAHRLDAERPVLTENNTLTLRNARHPLLIMKSGDTSSVEPLSLILGDSFKTLVISGPNAGGKTVALKTVGLLCMMVQCGLPVPAAADSEFPLFRRIIAEIGDPQSIENDLSTFSARLINVKSILGGMTGSDLILLDELGAGTDPQEGSSLAVSIIEYLTQNGTLTLASTHHTVLKIFANETDGVENASLAFDERSLKPTYRLSIGIPGSSYALELARRIGLPDDVLSETEKRMGNRQVKVEDLIRELEARTGELSKKEKTVSSQQDKLDRLVTEYEEKLKTVKKEYYTKLNDAITESERRVTDFNRRFEHLVKEIKESNASKEIVVKAKKEIEKEKKAVGRVQKRRSEKLKKIEKLEHREIPEEVPLEIGCTVKIKGFDQSGIVTAENPRKKSVTVQMASVKLEIERDKVTPVKSGKKQQISVTGSVPVSRAKPELDIRGMDVDGALSVLDQFLQQAVVDNLNEVRIIHGKGTGVLRRNVTDFLKHDYRITESRIGAWGEGDTGVTIAKINS